MVDLNFWKERQVFVTGATGFVGSWLVKELLMRGAHVVALIRDADPQSELFRSGVLKHIRVVSGELENFWTVERVISEHETDTIFHLGAQSLVGVAHRFPLQTFECNVRGTYNLLEACRIHRHLVQQIVIASSDKAYGERLELPYIEDLPLQGRHPYEVSKSCADLIAQSYYYTYGLPIGIVRCGNIYGGGDLNWSRIIPGTIRAFLSRERPIIRSDGSYVRDYIYVKDVVRAYLRIAECLSDPVLYGEAFNFSSQSRITVLELVAEIQRLMECAHIAPIIQNTAQGEIKSQYLSSQKASRLLSWKTEFSLESALCETIEWYREFLK